MVVEKVPLRRLQLQCPQRDGLGRAWAREKRETVPEEAVEVVVVMAADTMVEKVVMVAVVGTMAREEAEVATTPRVEAKAVVVEATIPRKEVAAGVAATTGKVEVVAATTHKEVMEVEVEVATTRKEAVEAASMHKVEVVEADTTRRVEVAVEEGTMVAKGEEALVDGSKTGRRHQRVGLKVEEVGRSKMVQRHIDAVQRFQKRQFQLCFPSQTL